PSLDPGHQTGQAQERALIALVLEEVLGLDRRQMQWTTRLLQGAVSTVRRMRRLVATMRHELGSGVDRQVVNGFARIASEGSRPSLSRFEELLDETMQAGGVSRARSQRARGVIGDLRRDLAKAGIATLEPDLVILDEFQRFRPLLDRDNDAGALAHDLFSFPSAKVVLLSATPYKPFTYAEEAEDHAKDFLRTIRFLHNETDAHSPRTNDVASLLADYRRDITTGAAAHQSAPAASSALLRGMPRNERPLIEERSMLDVRLDPADTITGTDLAGYVQLSELERVVSPTAGLVSVDYWKSAPYFLTFCNGYRLRQRIKECDRPELQPAL